MKPCPLHWLHSIKWQDNCERWMVCVCCLYGVSMLFVWCMCCEYVVCVVCVVCDVSMLLVCCACIVCMVCDVSMLLACCACRLCGVVYIVCCLCVCVWILQYLCHSQVSNYLLLRNHTFLNGTSSFPVNRKTQCNTWWKTEWKCKRLASCNYFWSLYFSEVNCQREICINTVGVFCVCMCKTNAHLSSSCHILICGGKAKFPLCLTKYHTMKTSCT
jgi:hypothetical protein